MELLQKPEHLISLATVVWLVLPVSTMPSSALFVPFVCILLLLIMLPMLVSRYIPSLPLFPYVQMSLPFIVLLSDELIYTPSLLPVVVGPLVFIVLLVAVLFID